MRRIGAEMDDKFVGPMPVVEFLDTFLPRRRIRGPTMRFTSQREALFQAVEEQESEAAMYNPLIRAIRPYYTSLEIVDTHSSPDPHSGVITPELLKPDLATYILNIGRNRTTDFSLMEHHVEVKFSESDDPFCDEGPFEHDTEDSQDTKGQITSHVVAQLATQFRTHIFSILICGGYARLLRWDRSGAIVTEAFSYRDRHLADFFWRYDRSPPEIRGVDLSVSTPSDAEIQLARRYLELGLEATFVKFAVYDKDNTITYFIGSKPTFKGNASPTGRATRTFVVFDLQANRVVFLKDTWRINLPDIEKEGHIYDILHKAKVSHIPPLIRGEDIPNQQTRTQDFICEHWAHPIKKPLRPHHHYRMVLGVVGRDLTSFGSSWELVNAMRDALQAHKEAYENAKILHRDISVGNILVTNNGHGLLIDWDLCKHVEDFNNAARQSERTGTWQFMSAMLATSPKAVHTLADDLESFLHVLSWVALQFTPHALTSRALTDLLILMYDHSYAEEDGSVRGGLSKMNYLLGGQVAKSGFDNAFLHRLLKDLTATCAVRYEERPSDELFAAFHKMRVQQPDLLQNPVFQNSLVAQYELKMEALESSDWMIDTFTTAAADRSAWPSNDRSVENLLSYPPTRGRKRKSDDGEPERLPRQRRRFPIPEDSDGEDVDDCGVLPSVAPSSSV